MSIRKNIFSALLFVLWLTLISFGTSIYYLNRIATISTELFQKNYQSVKVAEELIISSAKVDRALVMLCLDQDLENDETVLLKVISSERKIMQGYLLKLKKNVKDQDDQLLVDELSEIHQQYERHLARVAHAQDRKNLYLGMLRWQSEVLRFSSTKVVEHYHEALSQSDKALERTYLRAKINIFLATVFVLLIAAAALDKLPTWVIRPIEELTEKVRKATHSNASSTDQDMLVQPTSELAALADSFQTTSQQLKEAKEKFWLITDNLYDIIFFSTPDGNIFYTTPSIERALGYAPEEVLGSQTHTFLHPKDANRMNPSGVLARQNVYSEVRIKKKNGSYLWVDMSYVSHLNDQGEVTYTQYTARDASERKRDEEKIRKALAKEKGLNEQLVRTKHELDQLVYSASHNLRAPLTSVLGLASLLRLTTKKKERTELIDRMESSIHALDETIGEITDYSRNERTALEIAAVDFEETVVETIRHLQMIQPHDHPVAIDYQIDTPTPCHSDAQRLKVIFVNVGANAVKYRDLNRPESWLKIAVVQSDNKTTITFEDNGMGIKPELQSKVFDMFYRASEQATGAGLGLYIARSTVDKLQGTLSLHSVPGEGTTVTLTIPSLKKSGGSRLKGSTQRQLS